MIILRTWAELEALPADPILRSLLNLRRDQLIEYGELSELGCIVVVQPGDTIKAIETAVSFPIATDVNDGASFPDPSFTPAWEWTMRHGIYWEITYVLSDDGSGFVLIVPDQPDTNAELRTLLRTFAD